MQEAARRDYARGPYFRIAARTNGCSGWYFGLRIDPRQRFASQ